MLQSLVKNSAVISSMISEFNSMATKLISALIGFHQVKSVIYDVFICEGLYNCMFVIGTLLGGLYAFIVTFFILCF